MKLLILAPLCIVLFTQGYSQQNISGNDYVHNSPSFSRLAGLSAVYFRSNPFDKVFSRFMDNLMNDPGLINKQVHKRTDTSLFSFMGEYISHSPYSFKADRTEIILTETMVELTDSIVFRDTILTYQLLGYCYGGKPGMDAVKKEFTKFNRKYGADFMNAGTTELSKNEEIIGGMKNYFILGTVISPLTVTWMKLDGFQNVFMITVRIKVRENVAGLPVY